MVLIIRTWADRLWSILLDECDLVGLNVTIWGSWGLWIVVGMFEGSIECFGGGGVGLGAVYVS